MSNTRKVAVDVDKERKFSANIDRMIALTMRDQPEYLKLKNKATLLGEKGYVDASLAAHSQAILEYNKDKLKSFHPQFPATAYQQMGVLLSNNGIYIYPLYLYSLSHSVVFFCYTLYTIYTWYTCVF